MGEKAILTFSLSEGKQEPEVPEKVDGTDSPNLTLHVFYGSIRSALPLSYKKQVQLGNFKVSSSNSL
jgi:hypothetical protein